MTTTFYRAAVKPALSSNGVVVHVLVKGKAAAKSPVEAFLVLVRSNENQLYLV